MRPETIRKGFAIAKARKVAETFLITGPPVPVFDIITSLGIKIKYDQRLEAPVTVKYKDQYIILMPISDNIGRDRWSLCHELAHVILGHYDICTVDKIVNGNLVHNLSEREIYILEREADIFTAEFLMRKSWLKEFVELPVTWKQVGRLKNLFGVSWEAMINRLEETGYISKEELFGSLG
ncbi:MAG: ImmA/IrrE family metallo-endopeptidase [Firmicutes bacterium]|nr:ImmA/IrrE family metallo-endopeptidase [Bacillota bacterium]